MSLLITQKDFDKLNELCEEAEQQRDKLLEACEMHQDFLELNSLAIAEDSEGVCDILDKYKLVSSTELETLRDKSIEEVITETKKTLDKPNGK